METLLPLPPTTVDAVALQVALCIRRGERWVWRAGWAELLWRPDTTLDPPTRPGVRRVEL